MLLFSKKRFIGKLKELKFCLKMRMWYTCGISDIFHSFLVKVDAIILYPYHVHSPLYY